MIKISDFSAALQNLAAVHGEEEIVSVGAVNGQIGGLENPFVIHTWNDGIYYLPRRLSGVGSPLKRRFPTGRRKNSASGWTRIRLATNCRRTPSLLFMRYSVITVIWKSDIV